jgi:hypothetical protein
MTWIVGFLHCHGKAAVFDEIWAGVPPSISNGSGLPNFGQGLNRTRVPGPGQEPPSNRSGQVLVRCFPDRTYTRRYLAWLETDSGSNCTVPTTLASIKYISYDHILT